MRALYTGGVIGTHTIVTLTGKVSSFPLVPASLHTRGRQCWIRGHPTTAKLHPRRDINFSLFELSMEGPSHNLWLILEFNILAYWMASDTTCKGISIIRNCLSCVAPFMTLSINLMQLRHKTKCTWCRQLFWVAKLVTFSMAKIVEFRLFLAICVGISLNLAGMLTT